MLTFLDPHQIGYSSQLVKDIYEFGLLPGKRRGWCYPFDYSFIANEMVKVEKVAGKIIDIGAGPGAIHGYLEDRYKVNIVGIDNGRWPQDYVDVQANVIKVMNEENCWDIIISASAFEHNSMTEHKKLLEHSKKILKPGGILIVTSSVSNKNARENNQTNLSKEEVEDIYKDKFNNDYNTILERWKKVEGVVKGYEEKYKTTTVGYISFGYVYKK